MWENYFASIPERYAELFSDCGKLWQPLDRLFDFLNKNVRPIDDSVKIGDVYIGDDVEIGEGTKIEHGAVIYGPTIIGKNCEIRAGAYIRGQVIVGDGSTVGHTTELIRCILLEGARVDHFSYVSDSILGSGVHFGAGAKIANLRFDQKNIVVNGEDTGRVKLGGVLGDGTQLGVNVALGPGVIMEKNSWLTLPHQLPAGVYSREQVRDFNNKSSA